MGKGAGGAGAAWWAAVANLLAIAVAAGALVVGVLLVSDGTASAVELLALTAGSSGLGLLVKGVAILGGAARQAARHAEKMRVARARQAYIEAAARRAAWRRSHHPDRAGQKVPRAGAGGPGPRPGTDGTDGTPGPSQDPLATVRADARRGGAVLVWAGLIAFTIGVVGAWKAADEPHRVWCRDTDLEEFVVADCLPQDVEDEGR